MTDDELRLNLESLHANIAELHETVSRAQAENARQIGQLTKQIGQLTALLAVDAENIRALARIAQVHQDRLDRLEGQ